jgi:hypothetical protein
LAIVEDFDDDWDIAHVILVYADSNGTFEDEKRIWRWITLVKNDFVFLIYF